MAFEIDEIEASTRTSRTPPDLKTPTGRQPGTLRQLEICGRADKQCLTREFLHAKVIAISGVGGERNVLDAAKLLGARQTFQKPFSMPQLLRAVRYELEH